MGGHDHCCAPGCSYRRGDFADGKRVSFHVFASHDDDCRLWVSRVGRKGLPKTKVSKNTVLCSQHFFGGKKIKDRPHPIKRARGTVPLCRKMPSKRAADEEDIRPAKKSKTAEGRFSSPLTLRELSQKALAAHHAALTAAIAKQHHSHCSPTCLLVVTLQNFFLYRLALPRCLQLSHRVPSPSAVNFVSSRRT